MSTSTIYIYIYYYRLFKNHSDQHSQNMEPNKIPPSDILNSQTIFWIMT